MHDWMQPLAISPGEVEFSNCGPGQELTAAVCIKNTDTRPRSFRVKPPTGRWFSLRGIGHQHRLAPGLSLTFKVVFHGSNSAAGQQYSDTVKFACESVSAVQEAPLELWVHARPPRPRLCMQGDLQFGVVAVGATAKKTVQLLNSGSAPADYTITYDKSLPVVVEGLSGRLGPAGSPDCSTSISVAFAPSEPGAVVGELAISAAGMKEPLLCPLGASVVQSSYHLIDEATKAPVTEVQFGELFFGESASCQLTLVNNGPTEACFDLSFGSVSDLKALLATGPDEEASAPDDRLTAFLQVARIRAKARDGSGTMLKVSPIAGVIPPYSSTALCVTFKPYPTDGGRGFAAQPLSPQQQVQPFDGLLQVNLGAKHLRLSVKGCGLACSLKVQPDVLHFGIVPTYAWADQLLQLSNNCPQLPMQLAVVASAPYFSSLPAQLSLAPCSNGEAVIRYRPNGLGHHQAAMCVQVRSLRNPGKVLFEAPVQVMGSSLSVGPKQPLPGGITATPETFTLSRSLVDEADAATARLLAGKTYTRPKIWEVEENADRLQGIGSTDKFGVTQEVHQARAAHADQYNSFVRARRTAAARKYLTQPEGGADDVNMGMKPYRGLQPTPMRLKQQVDPLWTVSQNVKLAPATQKLPPASVLASIPVYKEWPETAQERTACSVALAPEQLGSLTVAPRQLDFGKLSTAAPGQQQLLVTNPLASPIHVVLNLSAIEGLSCIGPCSQVIPGGGTAKFVLQLHCHETQLLRDNIEYVINGCHFQPVLVAADVVPVTLDLSDEELLFSFSLDNWDDHVQQALTLDNPHSFPVDYELSVSSSVFSVTPSSGTIKPRSSQQAAVKWTPGLSSCTKSPAPSKQLPPQPKAPPAATAGAEAASTRKLSKSGSTGSSRRSAGGAAALPADGRQSLSRPLSKGPADSPASGSSVNPTTRQKDGAAAADRRQSSGAGSSLPTNSSSITVELPADPSPAAPAAAGAVGCQHTGFMTLQLRGGGDVPCKKVMLYGELPPSLLKFAAKEVNLGPVPLCEQQTALVQVKNTGSTDASFRVLPNSQLSVSPERGQVAAEGSLELEVALLLTQHGPMSTVLELDLRGGKTLKLPVRAQGIVPQVHVAEPVLQFPSTFIGSTHTLPLTLVNSTPVTTTLMCDLTQQPEFELHLSRDAWADAGYAACPVMRIGQNGLMSAVGSTRGSRRTTTHGTRSGADSNGGGSQFLITLQPSSSLPLQLVFRPSTPQPQHFQLPLRLQHSYISSSTQVDEAAAAAGGGKVAAGAAVQRRATTERRTSTAGSAKGGAADAAPHSSEPPKLLAVPVEAEGVVPKVILSKAALDFGCKVARRALQAGRSPHVFEVHLRNNTDAPLLVAVGSPAAPDAFRKPSSSHSTSRADAKQAAGDKADVAASSAYSVEGWDTRSSAAFCTLGTEEVLTFAVRFSPTEAKAYEACVPVFLDGNRSAPYVLVHLSGTGTLPRLKFDVLECVLPTVPLGVASTSTVFLVNDGYDNLELSLRLPPDASHLPISVSFPEGKLIGLAKERLPLEVRCCSSKPLVFTTSVDLLDEDGRAFSLLVTGAADNCSLSHAVFMRHNMERLQLQPPAVSGYPVPMRLVDGQAFNIPLDEAVGPLHLTKGVCKFLAAMTSSNWSKTARVSSKAGAAVDGINNPSSDADAAAMLRQWLLRSRGKGLLELIEALGGKPVSLKGAAAGKASAGGKKVDPVQQLLAVYEAALTHVQAQGGLMNAVKPEYLLPEADFTRLMEDRAAAAAGNPDLEEQLDYWAAVEAGFGAYSAMAWNCVLLQLLKVYALARVTPAAVRQLLSVMGLHNNTPAAAASSPAAAAAAKPTSKPSIRPSAGAKDKAAPPAAPATTEPATPAVVEPGSMPPDEVLSSSNVYCTAEACLLAWMNAHFVKAFPKLDTQVTNFGADLRDGLALGALIAAYWPGDSSGQMLSRLHVSPASARHLKENQEMVVKALQELCLPYELSAADIDEAEPLSMLLLVTYLFTALPQLLPRATLDFSCKLGDQQVREIQLSNPTRRPLAYAARLEGASDFSLEASMVKIDPGMSTQVPVRFSPGTSLPKACRLVLMSRRDNSAATAATLVFLLKGQADVRAPLKQVQVAAPLYQLASQEFSITNPFPTDCDFSISIVPVPDERPAKDVDKKAKKAGQASTGGSTSPARAQVDVFKMTPEAFGLDRHRLRLKAGASEKLRLSFLPLCMPATPAPATSPSKGRKAAAQQTPPGPPLVRGLLVLKDSDCGEFSYELCGEVAQPGPFLQHEAKVGLDGQQVVEVQLPFPNHLLENAKRSYTEKHPLGRDKEQLSRLRTDIGTTNERGERVLEYTVACDSPFFSAPATVTLKSSAPTQAMQDATAASSPAATRLNSPAQGARKGAPPGGAKEQQQGPAASNTIKLGLKPVGPGVYPAKLVLTSAYDVRHVELLVTAQTRGQACSLELQCPARQQVLQELPLLNASGDAPMTATATLTGKGFSGPREVSVQAKADGCYPLTFSPQGSGSFSGTLELVLSSTGEKLLYNLTGTASEPLAEGHVLVECQARTSTLKRLQVPNITGTLPLQYSVYADADWMSGPATLSCGSANRGDTYKLSVCPLVSGTHWGTLTFMAPDGNYCWWSVEVRATEPCEEGSIAASCPVHEALAIKVSLTNPTDKPLHLRAVYGCCSLLGPATFVAPAGPGAQATFECYYAPLVQGTEAGVLRLVSKEAGEFWWKLAFEATPALPQPPIELSAPLGGCASYMLSIANPTAADAIFTTTSSCPNRFWLSPDSVRVPSNSVADVQLLYKPDSYQTREEGRVCISSQAAGSYEYVCYGQGEAPTGAQSSSVSSILGTASTTQSLAFTNPFDKPVEVEVALSTVEERGTFKLLLPGAAAPPEVEGKDVAWAGLKDDPDDSPDTSCSGGALTDAASALTAVAAAVLAEEQQKQPPQLAVQQIARLTVAPGTVLELPVSFAPQVLRQVAAQVTVTVLPGPAQPCASSSDQAPEQEAPRPRLAALGRTGPSLAAAVPAAPPNPLVWRYEVTGVARADAPGVKFAVKCVAKQKAEQVLQVPLPGLDVEQAAAAAAAAKSQADGAVAASAAAAGSTSGISGSLGGFRYSLLLPEEHKAALAAAVSLEPLDAVPVPPASAAAGSSSSSSAAVAGASVLRYQLRFAPQKALAAVAQLQVECGEGGACWLYDVSLVATAPDITGVLQLEAHLGCTAELPLYLTASGSQPQPFTAEFTPDSPLNFDVQPCKGLLPPAAAEGGVHGAETPRGPAPLKVAFICKELGKVVQGKLVVITPDQQDTFVVKGQQPVYTPPQVSSLPSGTYLTATTASSRAKGESLKAGQAANTGAMVQAAGSVDAQQQQQQQQPTKKKNYLQQNIKSARGGSTGRPRS